MSIIKYYRNQGVTSVVVKEQIKVIFNLVLPMIGSRFLNMLTGFIGMIFLARLGHDFLATGALILSIQSTVFVLAMSIIFALGVVVSQKNGAKEYESVGLLFYQSLVLTFLLSIPMMIVYGFAANILAWFNEPPELLAEVAQYFHVFLWCSYPVALVCAIQQILYGILKQRIVIILNIITTVLYIPMSYSLIHGFWLIPSFGVVGLAYSSVINAMLTLILLLVCLKYNHDCHKYQFFSKKMPKSFSELKQLFQIGWPMCVQFGGEMLAFSFVTFMIGWLGVEPLAAIQVLQQWMFLVIVPIFSVSEAIGILVGKEIGAEQYGQLRLIADLSLFLGLMIVAPIGLVFIFSPGLLSLAFLDSSLVTDANITFHYIRQLFFVGAFTLLFDGFRNMMSGALRGLFDTRYAMMVGILLIWCVSVPLGYVFSFVFQFGVVGFSVARLICYITGFLMLYRHWIRKVHAYDGGLLKESQAVKV